MADHLFHTYTPHLNSHQPFNLNVGCKLLVFIHHTWEHSAHKYACASWQFWSIINSWLPLFFTSFYVSLYADKHFSVHRCHISVIVSIDPMPPASLMRLEFLRNVMYGYKTQGICSNHHIILVRHVFFCALFRRNVPLIIWLSYYLIITCIL
jgi:hypothetical protein